jgi:DNA-binding NarL/FixJ family response regulator
MSHRPRLLLADDHEIVLHGLRALLSKDYDIVGEARDGRSLVELAVALSPEVVVTDVSLPDFNGIDGLRQARAKGVAARWIMLSMHADAAYVVRALSAGASGYVVKTSAGDELMAAIEAARAGKTYISKAAESDALVELLSRRTKRGGSSGHVTPRQAEVLRLLVRGLSAKEVGVQLNISTRTAEAHKYQMMEALGLKTTAELIHYAIRNGIT